METKSTHTNAAICTHTHTHTHTYAHTIIIPLLGTLCPGDARGAVIYARDQAGCRSADCVTAVNRKSD